MASRSAWEWATPWWSFSSAMPWPFGSAWLFVSWSWGGIFWVCSQRFLLPEEIGNLQDQLGRTHENPWKSMKIHENPWKSHSYIVRHHFPHEDSSIGLPVVFLSDSKATTARSTPPPERNGSQETSWPSSSASLLAASWRLERNWESCVCLASHTLVVC